MEIHELQVPLTVAELLLQITWSSCEELLESCSADFFIADRELTRRLQPLVGLHALNPREDLMV